MLIAQISDSHIAAPDKLTYGIVPMAQNLARCVDHINRLMPKPDLVLMTGDVANDWRQDQTELAKSILDGLHCPYYVVPGNHDDRAVIWDVFGGAACPAKPDGFINYVIDGFPVRMIGIDTLESGQSGGVLCDTRLGWIADRLADDQTTPTVLFMHHPPLKLAVPETDVDGFVGSEALGALISNAPNVKRILCGHIHLLTHTLWNGTIVTTAPSMGMQLALDLTQAKPSKFLKTDPGYVLHHLTADNHLVTHCISVDGNDTRYDFVEQG